MKHVEFLIGEYENEIAKMSQDGDIVIEWDNFNVVFGMNGVYYLSSNDHSSVKCLKNCVDENECDCSRMFPNSMSFLTPADTARFIVLNILNGQSLIG